MTRPKLDLTGARILVVDDIPENLDVLLHTLEESDYEVLVATDGQQALQLAAEERPDAILLDVMMPGIDGYETCRRLKAQTEFEDVPVLFLTARDDIEGVIEGFTAGALRGGRSGPDQLDHEYHFGRDPLPRASNLHGPVGCLRKSGPAGPLAYKHRINREEHQLALQHGVSLLH